MTKKILLSAIVVSSLAISAFAGGTAAGTNNARIQALSLNNAQIEDRSNIWANPAYIVGQKDEIFINSTNQTTVVDFIGTTYKADFGTLGVVAGRGMVTSSTVTTATTSPATNNAGEIFYGTSLSNMDIGVRLSTQTAVDVTGATTNNSNGATELEVGVNLKDMGLDISLTTLLVGETANSVAVAANSGLEQITLNARYKVGSDMITTANVTNTTAKPDVAGKGTLGLSGGVTYKKALNADTTSYLTSGLAITRAATTATASTLSINVPIVASVESKVNENWIYRASASTSLLISNMTINGTVITSAANTNANGTNIRGGLGYTSGNFILDGSLGTGARFAGGNVLTGLFGLMTANYSF